MTPELLRAAAGCTQDAADLYAQHLSDACEQFGIDTPQRIAAFLAQLAHESGSLRHAREVWGPTQAQETYEGRRDLGNTEPGDGFRFRGRGLIQCTGRANYRTITRQLAAHGAPDFEHRPEALEEPRWAALSAAAWWAGHGCNALADAGDIVGLGRLINRGNARSPHPANGEADRLARTERAMQALGVTARPPAPDPEPRTDYEGAPPQERKTMPLAPIIAAVLPSLISSIPKLGRIFGSGSEVAERNIKAAELVVGAVTQATGAVNAQDAAERLASDPAAVQAATKAVDAIWYELTEAGGGGIDGARRFAREASADSPVVWRIVAVVTYCALAFLGLANVIAVSAWGVAMWRGDGIESATQILVQVIAADILSSTSAISFWLGSSFGSRRKDEARSQ